MNTELAAEHRVPIEGDYYWIVNLDARCIEITPAEMTLVRGYTEMIVSTFYREPFRSQALEDPIGCKVSGHNTVTLLKRADGDWAYRRHTWTQGPRYMPPGNVPEYDRFWPMDLPTLLRRIETSSWGVDDAARASVRWMEWSAGDGAPLLEAVG